MVQIKNTFIKVSCCSLKIYKVKKHDDYDIRKLRDLVQNSLNYLRSYLQKNKNTHINIHRQAHTHIQKFM